MKKHTIREHLDLWVSNLKYRRLLSPQLARDPFGRNMTWADLPFVAFCCWDFAFGALWRGETIPAGVMLVGAPFTMKQWDETCEWARQLISQHPEWGLGIEEG